MGSLPKRDTQKYGSGFTTLILCMLFLGGVQLITIGILGEYIGRIHNEVKGRPLFVVDRRCGFGADTGPQVGLSENGRKDKDGKPKVAPLAPSGNLPYQLR